MQVASVQTTVDVHTNAFLHREQGCVGAAQS